MTKDSIGIARSCFITLTYDELHLPEDNSLDLEHWQLFAKKARHKIGPFKFFHCGEYGKPTVKNNYVARPHFHAAIFGKDFRHDRKEIEPTRTGFPQHISETLDDLWDQGRATISDLDPDSAAYIARYAMKKQQGRDQERNDRYYACPHTGFIRKPEYATMSRNPGLGKTWIDKYMDEVYPADEVMFKGRKSKPPKFYDTQYERINPEGFKQLKLRRQEEAQDVDTSYDKLATREKIRTKQTKSLRRDL